VLRLLAVHTVVETTEEITAVVTGVNSPLIQSGKINFKLSGDLKGCHLSDIVYMAFKNTLPESKVKLIHVDRELFCLTHQNVEDEIGYIHHNLI
jgi:hypothetical protein